MSKPVFMLLQTIFVLLQTSFEIKIKIGVSVGCHSCTATTLAVRYTVLFC